MKIVVIDDVECELLGRYTCGLDGAEHLTVRRILPKKKTMVQVAAETWKMTEDEFKRAYPEHIRIYDYIEQRLQALERKLEGK